MKPEGMRSLTAIWVSRMARTPKGTPPSYPQKPHNGQARLTVRLLNGRHDLILGPFGSPEGRAEYRRILAELEVHGGRYPLKQDGGVAVGLTIDDAKKTALTG